MWSAGVTSSAVVPTLSTVCAWRAGIPGGKLFLIFGWADDIERTVRELEDKGVEFVMKPQKADWGTAAIFKDLDGNTFVISSR